MTLWLSAKLRAQAGILAPVAERFLETWLGDDARTFRGGPQGLVALCDYLEHWLTLEEVSPASEQTFVDGAGALLGILLIDHVTDGAHVARGSVHRVRLGRHGFFDPFTAIESALDAHSVRVELARQVKLAEAEASESGPVSRVVAAFLRGLDRQRPDLVLDDHFDQTLSLRGKGSDEKLEIDLRRAVDVTRDQGLEAVERVAARLLAMLPGGPARDGEFGDVRSRLVPRLARSDTMRELGAQGQAPFYAHPLTSELVVALMLEYEGQARYVRESELSAWGVSSRDALGVSLENLAARSECARIACTETEHGPLLVARTGDGRDSARVLLRSLYKALSARLGERVYVGVPHRDTFFACAGENAQLVRELARRTAHDAERAPHRLSPRLYQLTASGMCE